MKKYIRLSFQIINNEKLPGIYKTLPDIKNYKDFLNNLKVLRKEFPIEIIDIELEDCNHDCKYYSISEAKQILKKVFKK